MYTPYVHPRSKVVAAGLAARASVAPMDTANPYRGYTLMEVARECLVQAGVRNLPAHKIELLTLAFTHGNSDFPNIVANVGNLAMMKGYDEAPETYPQWTNTGFARDFKQGREVHLGGAPSLREVNAGAEYKYITFGERSEVYALLTYGELFGVNRQAIINDEVGAFTTIPRKLGRAARRTVGDLAYAQLTGNPVMGDGVQLFHASHGNLAAASAISTSSVDAMRVGMATQKDVGVTTGALHIELAKLIVPKSIEGQALTVRNSQVEVEPSTAAPGTRNNTASNSQYGRFEVVADARLDAASTSVWYGVANPALHDTVTLYFLEGIDAPYLEQRAGWGIDGLEFKVRIDVAAKALDWKTLQRNG